MAVVELLIVPVLQRTLFFKYEVVQHLRHLQQLKKDGASNIDFPNDMTADRYRVSKGLVSKWAKQEAAMREKLIYHKQRGAGKAGSLCKFSSKKAQRLTLHNGRNRKYAAAEAELHKRYKESRAKGLRVGGHWLQLTMKILVLDIYGADASFKASHHWLQNFTAYYSMSLRKKSNKKHLTLEQRLPACKRWHARFRRRLLRAAPGRESDSKWGRWLPQDRLSIDQVPCNLREGGNETYEDICSDRVWIRGTKADCGKRFCTLQVAARCANGSPDEPRHGQPKLTICFRGKGKVISAAEKAAWHKDVHVRFQEKAWFDEQLCEDYAKVEVREITQAARNAGRETVVIFDNLSGQTTETTHKRNLAQSGCKRHLLPGGMTDELQLVDDGVGYALKNEMGRLLDAWLMGSTPSTDGSPPTPNLDFWVAEGRNGFPMWRKRVLITEIAAAAWENVCARFDFEKAATRLGMRMTIDGTNDHLIRLQGCTETYTFCDADGGDAGAESDDAAELERENVEDPALQQAVRPNMTEEEILAAANVFDDVSDDGDGAEREELLDDGDESEADDTSGDTAATFIGSAVAPEGYSIVEAWNCPDFSTPQQRRNFIGKTILYGWDSTDVVGWMVGTVHSTDRFTRADLAKCPSANFAVKYSSRMTGGKLNGIVACELSEHTHGRTAWWVQIEKE